MAIDGDKFDDAIKHGTECLGPVVRITNPEPGIWLDLWGGISGVFAGIDQFGRIVDQPWQNNIAGTPVDIDRYKYGYDQNSNRLWKANVVGTAAASTGLDEFYAYDPLNRLTAMQRGVLNSTKTGITGTPSVEQDWTLDATGNWANFITKASGTTTLNQTRTANPVNEIPNITASTGATWVTPAYDAAGNTITMPQPADPTSGFTATYDAWNMLAGLYDGATPVAKYQYDGRRFRIGKQTYASGVLSETRRFFFTSNWQDVEERVGTSTTMDLQYIWGIRYIDELICRDDATPQRLYAAQDANFNLTSIANTGGSVVERYLFDPYGNRTIMDGSWSVNSSSAYNWSIGFQGLMDDAETELIYVNNRYLDVAMGKWPSRDPIGYLGGTPNLYEYLNSNPVNYRDELGLACDTDAICSGTNIRYPRGLPGSAHRNTAWGCLITCTCNPPQVPALDWNLPVVKPGMCRPDMYNLGWKCCDPPYPAPEPEPELCPVSNETRERVKEETIKASIAGDITLIIVSVLLPIGA